MESPWTTAGLVEVGLAIVEVDEVEDEDVDELTVVELVDV